MASAVLMSEKKFTINSLSMEEASTKLYEATRDFSLAKMTAEGNPDGEESYVAGTQYRMPNMVAALAPEGALKEVEETPATPPTPSAEDAGQDTGTPTTPGSSTGTPPATEPTATAPAAQSGFVGGHTMADDPMEGMRGKKKAV